MAAGTSHGAPRRRLGEKHSAADGGKLGAARLMRCAGRCKCLNGRPSYRLWAGRLTPGRWYFRGKRNDRCATVDALGSCYAPKTLSITRPYATVLFIVDLYVETDRVRRSSRSAYQRNFGELGAEIWQHGVRRPLEGAYVHARATAQASTMHKCKVNAGVTWSIRSCE